MYSHVYDNSHLNITYFITIISSNYSYDHRRAELQYHKSESAAYGFLFMHRIQWRATLCQQKNNAYCALCVYIFRLVHFILIKPIKISLKTQIMLKDISFFGKNKI